MNSAPQQGLRSRQPCQDAVFAGIRLRTPRDVLGRSGHVRERPARLT